MKYLAIISCGAEQLAHYRDKHGDETAAEIDGSLGAVAKLLLQQFSKESPSPVFLWDSGLPKWRFFLLVATLLLYFKKKFYYATEQALRPFPDFYVLPNLFLLLFSPVTLYRLFLVLTKRKADSPLLGFNKASAAGTQWYLNTGKRLLHCGSWGYSYTAGMGMSFKGLFYQHVLTYGLLFNRLGFRRYTLLALAVALGGASLVTMLSYDLPIYLLVLFYLTLLVSPFFWGGYIVFTKMENLAWGLFLPTLICAFAGHDLLFALLFLAMSYLSVTVSLLTLPYILIVLLFHASGWMLLVAAIPALIKLDIDLLAFLESWGVRPFLDLVASTAKREKEEPESQKKPEEKTEEIDPKSLEQDPFGLHRNLESASLLVRYLLFLMLPLVFIRPELTLIALLLPVCVILQYRFDRFLDTHTVFRLYLFKTLLLVYLLDSPVFTVFAIIFLLVDPRLLGMDEIQQNATRKIESPKVLRGFPFFEHVYEKEETAPFEDFLEQVPANSRVGFEYDRSIKASAFKNLYSFIEQGLIPHNTDFLLTDWMPYNHPKLFGEYREVSTSNDADRIREFGKQYGISCWITFSKVQEQALTDAGCRCLAALRPIHFRGRCFAPKQRHKIDSLSIFQIGHHPIIEASHRELSAADYDIAPNQIYIQNVRDVVIKYAFHKRWKLSNEVAASLQSYRVGNMDFMRVVAKAPIDVTLRFSRPNFYLR